MTVTERGNRQQLRLGIAREFNNYEQPSNCEESFVVEKWQSGKRGVLLCEYIVLFLVVLR